MVDIRRASSGTGPPRARNLPLLIGLTAVVMIGAWAVVGFDVMPRGRGRPSMEPSSSTTVAKAKAVPPVMAPEIPRRSPVQVVQGRSETDKDASKDEAEDDPDAGLIAEIGRGRELFLREWMPDDPRSHGGDGLGPVYNESSCVACHNLGGVGGGGPNGKNVDILSSRERPRSQTGTGKRTGGPGDEAPGKIHPGFLSASSVVLHRFGTAPEYVLWRLGRLAMAGGASESGIPQNVLDGPPGVLAKVEIEHSLMSAGLPFSRRTGRSSQGRSREDGVVRSQRNPTALFGAGLIDAIPDRVIEGRSRTTFPAFPEIRGRVSRLEDGRIGRFGWKAQLPTLKEFVLTACAVELGLEVPDHPQGGDPLVPEIEAPGPDLDVAECDALVAYVRSLPAPQRQDPGDAAGSGEIRAGRELFVSIGCGTCHAPDLGDVAGIYSDLLLHDMGPEGSDTGSYRVFRPEPTGPGPTTPGPLADDRPGHQTPAALGATQREWRTPPLWGLRDSGPYLHDGRAETLDQAIALHGGQGKDPMNRYFGLSPRRRQQVQSFLKSLVAPAGAPSS